MRESVTRKSACIGALLAAIVLVAIDQWTKYLAVIHLKGKSPFVLISGVFELHYLENQGAAFGILQGKRVFFVIMTTIFLVIACYAFYRIPMTKRNRFIHAMIVALAAGAVGNMIDRVLHNYVIDFFYFSLINFPIFNVADIYVTLTLAAFLLLIFFYYKDEDLEKIGTALVPYKKSKKESK